MIFWRTATLAGVSLLVSPVPGALAEESDSDALNYFLNHSADIVRDARSYLDEVPPIVRNQAAGFPVLSELGSVKLQMTSGDVRRLLGQAEAIEETEQGWRWTYSAGDDEKLVVIVGLSRRVERIFSDSARYLVPKDLTVGRLLAEFETVYGSRRYRKSAQVSRKLKLIKYPFSNLALVVDSASGQVKSLMVFQARPAEGSGG